MDIIKIQENFNYIEEINMNIISEQLLKISKQIYRQNNKYAFNLFDKTQRQLKNAVVNYIDQLNKSVKQQYEQAQNDWGGPDCELYDCSGKMYWDKHKKEILQRLKTDFSKEEWNNLNSDQKFEWLKQLLQEKEFKKDIPHVQYADA